MHVVILNGQTELFDSVCTQFNARGVSISVIDLQSNSTEPGGQEWHLERADDLEIKNILKSIAEKDGVIDGFLYLPPTKDSGLKLNLEKMIFFFAKHLSRWYRRSTHSSRKVFMLMTQLDGQFGLSGIGNWNPREGSLNGLVKTLNQEWTDVFCRLVDFSSGLPSEVATSRILDEWMDADLSLCEVGYTNKGRITIGFEEISDEKGELA